MTLTEIYYEALEDFRLSPSGTNMKDVFERATKKYAEQEVRLHLIRAAERVNYPYRDEYGCGCDVPGIVLGTTVELN